MGNYNKNIQYFKLNPETELRFQVETKSAKVYLMLTSGYAEILGSELVQGRQYKFATGTNVAVFSWQGCTLAIKGKRRFNYIRQNPLMSMYCSCHNALEDMRTNAYKNKTRGPVGMVVGSRDVSKSNFCRLLLNYAVRMNRKPTFVDLDVEQEEGVVALPGSIGALLIEEPASVGSGFSQKSPVVHHVGYRNPSYNDTLFNMVCGQLAKSVKEKIETTNHSGIIINTCCWTTGDGYKHLLEVSKTFEVDIIFVIDQESLYHELVRDVGSHADVVLLPKSSEVVRRSEAMLLKSGDRRIREYFYGTGKNPVSPHVLEIKWSEMKLFKIGAPKLPECCLPYGVKIEDHLTKVISLIPNHRMLHHLLAVSFATEEDLKKEEIPLTRIAGFVCITNIDVDRQVLTLLSLQPQLLPNALLVLSDIKLNR